jgi:hypothetical protein
MVMRLANHTAADLLLTRNHAGRPPHTLEVIGVELAPRAIPVEVREEVRAENAVREVEEPRLREAAAYRSWHWTIGFVLFFAVIVLSFLLRADITDFAAEAWWRAFK